MPPFHLSRFTSNEVALFAAPPRTQLIRTHCHNRFVDKFHSRFVYSAVVADASTEKVAIGHQRGSATRGPSVP